MRKLSLGVPFSALRDESEGRHLAKRIEFHDGYFNSLIELIPKSIYIGKTDEEREEEALNTKFFKHKKKSAIKQQKKEDSKRAKKRKYDLENQKTVLETQQELKRNEEANGNDEEAREPPTSDPASTAVTNGNSIETLRFRLQEKIKTLQGKRKDTGKGKSQKNKHKRLKEKKGPQQQPKEKAPSSEEKQEQIDLKPQPPPLPNLQENLTFGSLTLPTSDKKKRKGKHGEKKNLHKLLEKAEAKRQRLEELKQTEEGKKQAHREQWGDMLKQASGQKVHDNPQQLKKAIKKREKKKEKSRKKWKDREQAVTKAISAKQEKREGNLAKRKNRGKVPTQDDKDPKQSSRRAGFEGKKTDFINKGKGNLKDAPGNQEG